MVTTMSNDWDINPIQVASEWHGGQASALYSLSSTGKVWDEEHRELLLREIDIDLRALVNSGQYRSDEIEEETDRLNVLMEWVEEYDLGDDD